MFANYDKNNFYQYTNHFLFMNSKEKKTRKVKLIHFLLCLESKIGFSFKKIEIDIALENT